MKNLILKLLIALLSISTLSLWAQNDSPSTIGLTHYSDAAFEGYTLFAPMGDTMVYLIDNCGYKVHEWETQARPGAETKLLEDGRLLRAERVDDSGFTAGGSGGRLCLYDWDSNVLWSYVYSEENVFQQHHDVELLPNGNMLLLAWEYHSKEEAIAIGRFPALVTDDGIWSERVVEIQPIGTDSAAINQQGLTIENWKIDVLPSSIDLPNIPAGFYFVAVQNRKNKQIDTFKIIESY